MPWYAATWAAGPESAWACCAWAARCIRSYGRQRCPLRSLAEDIGATAHLTLVDGTDALAVAVVEPTWTDYHVAYRAGFRHPLDRGAAGRAILAARAKPVAEPAFTLTHGELEAGASGAAAALMGVTGVEGSVGVVMLADAVPERVGPRVVDAAREVADALR